MQEKQQPQPPTHNQKQKAKTNNQNKNAVRQTNSRPEEGGKEAATRASSFQIISYQLGKTQTKQKCFNVRENEPKKKRRSGGSKKVASFYQES